MNMIENKDDRRLWQIIKGMKDKNQNIKLVNIQGKQWLEYYKKLYRKRREQNQT